MTFILSAIMKALSGFLDALCPIGTIQAFGGAIAPDGFAICDGQAISRTGNPVLFQRFGVTYGSGDGETTFNLPDLRGHVLAGAGGGLGLPGNNQAGFTHDGVGAKGGSAAHQLTVEEMPSHQHHVASDTTSSDLMGDYGIVNLHHEGSVQFPSDPVGGDGPHNNIQPTALVHFIVRLG